MTISEQDCLAAARAGDSQAFDQLCRAHRQEIYNLCFRFLHNAEDSQDTVQEIFARAWQHLGNYRGEASFRTWLWEIGRNLCLNRLRARKSTLNRRTISYDGGEESEGYQALNLPDTAPTPEEVLLNTAQIAQLREHIQVMATEKGWKTTDWELFLLRIEKEISYAEFAQRQGRDEAYWRNRWRDKIKPVLERVGAKIGEISGG